MKYKLFCIMLIFQAVMIINAEETINFSFQMANYGYGINFSPNVNSIELSLESINIFLDNPKTNLGLKISPFNLYTHFEFIDEMQTKNTTYLNFFNIDLYWNLLKDNKSILGPFVSFEYITIRDWRSVDFNDFTINTGLKFIYKNDNINFSIINYNSDISFYCLEMEIGYRYNFYDKHQFFFLVKTDFILSLLGIANFASFFSN